MKIFSVLIFIFWALTPTIFAQAEKKDTVEAHQFFIQIIPNNDLVKCGRFREFDTLEITKIFFTKEDSSALWSMDEALDLVFDRQHGRPLFYIHGFYAATPKLTQRTVLAYKKLFLKDSINQTTDIIHIVWDSNKLSYRKSRKNIKNSRQVLAQILGRSAEKLDGKINLLGHSMGNQFLMETIKSGLLTKPIFDKLVLAAPDFDMVDFDVYQYGLAAVANKVLVLYSKRDRVLAVSRLKNQERRLGQRRPTRVESDHFVFVDCAKKKINHSFVAKMNKHTYFLASDEVRKTILLFLGSSNE